MSKLEQYKEELIRTQELAILDTIDLVERANGCDKETKVGRGDAFWLYKSGNQTLAIAARIEQLLTTKLATSDTNDDEEARKEAEAEKLLATVRKEITKRKGRPKKDANKEGK